MVLVQAPPAGERCSIWYATFRKDEDGVAKLLENGADVDEAHHHKTFKEWVSEEQLYTTTSLQLACRQKNPEIVALLLKYGASVSVTGDTGRTPLWYAARAGCQASVELLLHYKADVYFQDMFDDTPLKIALMCGAASASLIRVLIDHGSNVHTIRSCKRQNIHVYSLLDSCGEGSEIHAVVKDGVETRAKFAAFAMGHHKRLGPGSLPYALDTEIMKMILKM
jgi:ankyrin repeat protein